jgi:hypothetical protein
MDIQVKAGLSMPSIAEALQKCRGEPLLIHYHTTNCDKLRFPLFSYLFRKCGKDEGNDNNLLFLVAVTVFFLNLDANLIRAMNMDFVSESTKAELLQLENEQETGEKCSCSQECMVCQYSPLFGFE